MLKEARAMLHDFVQPELGAAWVREAETSQRPPEALHSPLRETTPPVSTPPGNSPPQEASPRHFSFSPGFTEADLGSDVTLTDLSHAIPTCTHGSLDVSPGSSASLDSSLDLTMFPPPQSGDVMSQEPGFGLLTDCPQFECDYNQPIDSTYTHKQRNKAHKPKRKRRITSDQRSAANQRERKRMVTINEAFEQLQARIPTFSYEKRLSRIETLKLAIGYIWFMREVLNGAHPQCINLSYFIDSLPLLSTKIDRWDLCGQS